LLLQGLLSDRVVARQLLPAFARKAAFILDWADVLEANTSFWQMQKSDPRHEGAASRSQGVAPNCNRCTDGLFLDILSNKLVGDARPASRCIPAAPLSCCQHTTTTAEPPGRGGAWYFHSRHQRTGRMGVTAIRLRHPAVEGLQLTSSGAVGGVTG
jgi:hypothetical protein